MKIHQTAFILKFFSLTFLLTWFCWIPAGLLSVEQHKLLITILHYAGGIMPTVVALILLYFQRDLQYSIDYWKRLIDLRRIGKSWYIVILLIVPMMTTISIVLDILLGGIGAEFDALSNFIRNPFSLIPFVLFMLVFGPLPEEMAWRGYALDRLQERWNALSSSLILGAAWTIWHLPLFWIQGTYQHGLGVGTPQFWLYLLDKIPQTVFMTWLFNNNRRSTATAILFHFMVNFVGELVDLSLQAEIIYIAFWWAGALLIIMIYKPQTLVREKVKQIDNAGIP